MPTICKGRFPAVQVKLGSTTACRETCESGCCHLVVGGGPLHVSRHSGLPPAAAESALGATYARYKLCVELGFCSLLQLHAEYERGVTWLCPASG